jgi:hypothetical protein
MKYSSRILSLLVLVSMSVFFAGCDKGEGNKTSTQDKQIAKLVGVWEAVDVDFDGTTPDGYETFTITITGDAGDQELGYSTANHPAGPWPNSGTFEFGSDVTSTLIRSGDELTVNYVVTGDQLTLSFDDYAGDTFDAGRTESIAGDWTFTFTKAD